MKISHARINRTVYITDLWIVQVYNLFHRVLPKFIKLKITKIGSKKVPKATNYILLSMLYTPR